MAEVIPTLENDGQKSRRSTLILKIFKSPDAYTEPVNLNMKSTVTGVV